MAININAVLSLVRMIVETTLMKRTAARLPPGECRDLELDLLLIGTSLSEKKLKCHWKWQLKGLVNIQKGLIWAKVKISLELILKFWIQIDFVPTFNITMMGHFSCAEGQMMCQKSKICISNAWVCDGDLGKRD